jgi:EAL domain-containing protein (putative c-di-GMP-specific phosphodiesterase class I)
METQFQPIFDLHSGAVAGYEALLRPKNNLLRPDASLIENESASRLEYETIARALVAAARLPQAPILYMEVTTRLLLTYASFADLVRASPWVLAIGLSTKAAPADHEAVRKAIHGLGQRVVVAISNAREATIEDLIQLEPAIIRIDRYLTAGIARDPVRQSIILGLSYFAMRTGATLVANGVESRQGLERLLDAGISLGQGAYLGPARSAEAIADDEAPSQRIRFPARPSTGALPLPMDDTPIDQVVNIGVNVAAGLQRLGITNRRELAAAGAVETWRQLRQIAPNTASPGTLVALAAAIQGVRSSALPRRERGRLGVLTKVEANAIHRDPPQ